jgi:crotonobetainyl-CoA:carnitine CoA-transferase CaiB-like acyl-CoA transferase
MSDRPQSETPGGPLAGVRILDLSTVVMGPYATQVLADLGADVIKVEPPAGDNLRAVGPMRNPGMGHIYLHLNRNKRSVVLDLKTPEGLEACLKLAESCDALLYNIRPQAMARLGLSYETVAARNPRIVYLGAYGYGEAGPYAGRPAYDDLIQGQTGIAALSAQQSGDVPRYAPLTLADRAVGLHVGIALVSAVLHARSTGQGQQVEIPMFEGMAHLVLGDHLGGATFDPPLGPTGYARLLAPHRRPYATADGYISLLIYNDKHWRNFFDLIGRPELSRDPRFSTHGARAAHIGEVYAFVADVIATRSSQDWLERSIPWTICCRTSTWPRPASSGPWTTPAKAGSARPRRWADTKTPPPRYAAPPPGWASIAARCWPKPAMTLPGSTP